MNLQEFIEKSETKNEINRIPTKSSKSTLAKKIVNDVLAENPEWFNIISALVSYPVQNWASHTRKKLNINERDIKDVIEYGESTYFGIKSKRSLTTQLRLNEQTSKIMFFIDSAIRQMIQEDKDNEVLDIVHGNSNKEISRYKFIETYKNALVSFCEKYSSKFDELYEEIEKDFEELDDDCQFAFNNTQLLLDLKRKIGYLESENIETDETLNKMNACISSLDSYIINPDDLSSVMELYSQGKSEETIAALLDRSRVYVRDRKKEGIRALSYLIWGYSTKNIVNNLR